MSVTVRGRVPSKWDDNTALHLTERLRTLEKAVAGGAEVFRSPAAPATGPTIIVTPGTGGTGGPSSGVTDHGDLTGLSDNDHPQYGQRFEAMRPSPHVHGIDEIRGERPALATAHTHPVEERATPPMAHAHRVEDIRGLESQPNRLAAQPEPDWWSIVMFSRVFGG